VHRRYSLSLVTGRTNGGNVEVFNASRSLRTLTVHDRDVLTGAYKTHKHSVAHGRLGEEEAMVK
jgi:hypothetical protein